MKSYHKIFISLATGIAALMFTGCSTESEIFVPLEVDNGLVWQSFSVDPQNNTDWSTSRSNKWIAVTNYEEKSQYLIEWEGGMNSGEKENATLKISQNGGAPVEYPLQSLILYNDGENCSMSFTGLNKEKGSIKIPL